MLLIATGFIQIIGLCFIGFVHLKAIGKINNTLNTVAMFKKSRSLQDLIAMKQMGLTEEQTEETEEVEEEEIKSVDELSEFAISKISDQL